MQITIHDNIDFIYHLLSILISFNTLIVLLLGSFKNKNKYVKYFSIAYIAGFLMVTCHTLQLFSKIYLGEFYKVFTYIELISIGIIILGIILLLELFIEKLPVYFYLLICFIAAIPIIFVFVSFFIPVNMYWLGYHFLYWFLYITMGICCILFAVNQNKISNASNKQAIIIVTLLSVFVLIFSLQKYFNININPLPLYYIILNSMLIKYSWKNFFITKLDNDITKNNSFIQQYNITQRENEIIEFIVNGKSNKDIAQLLFISDNTVKNHIYNIYKKMGINSRFELISIFIK